MVDASTARVVVDAITTEDRPVQNAIEPLLLATSGRTLRDLQLDVPWLRHVAVDDSADRDLALRWNMSSKNLRTTGMRVGPPKKTTRSICCGVMLHETPVRAPNMRRPLPDS